MGDRKSNSEFLFPSMPVSLLNNTSFSSLILCLCWAACANAYGTNRGWRPFYFSVTQIYLVFMQVSGLILTRRHAVTQGSSLQHTNWLLCTALTVTSCAMSASLKGYKLGSRTRFMGGFGRKRKYAK